VSTAATSQVVIDEALAAAVAADGWQVDSLGPLQLKGFADSVPALVLRRR